MGKIYTIFQIFENPGRDRQARKFTTSVPKILDLKLSYEQDIFRKLTLGAPEDSPLAVEFYSQEKNFLFLQEIKIPLVYSSLNGAVDIHVSNNRIFILQ